MPTKTKGTLYVQDPQTGEMHKLMTITDIDIQDDLEETLHDIDEPIDFTYTVSKNEIIPTTYKEIKDGQEI